MFGLSTENSSRFESAEVFLKRLHVDPDQFSGTVLSERTTLACNLWSVVSPPTDQVVVVVVVGTRLHVFRLSFALLELRLVSWKICEPTWTVPSDQLIQ